MCVFFFCKLLFSQLVNTTDQRWLWKSRYQKSKMSDYRILFQLLMTISSRETNLIYSGPLHNHKSSRWHSGVFISLFVRRNKACHFLGYHLLHFCMVLQGSRGRRILRPGTHKSASGLLKIPKAESAGRMFFPVGLLLIMVGLFEWSLKSATCYSYRR